MFRKIFPPLISYKSNFMVIFSSADWEEMNKMRTIDLILFIIEEIYVAVPHFKHLSKVIVSIFNTHKALSVFPSDSSKTHNYVFVLILQQIPN